MKIKLEHNRQNLALLELITFTIISAVYVIIIKDVYGYMGFKGDINLSKLVFGWIIFFFTLFIGFKIKDNFFFAVWHVIFVLFFFGQLIYYQYSDGSKLPVYSNLILLIVLFFASRFKINFKVYSFKGNLESIILLVSTMLMLPIILKYFRYINFNNLLLDDIYETRLFFRRFNDPYFGYLRAPLSRVIFPFIMILAIIKRKPVLAVFSGGMIVFIFLVGALKSVFIGMIAAVFFMFGKRYLDKVYLMIYLFLFLSTLGLIIFMIDSSNTFLVNSFVRRILFIPPMLDNHYYILFENNPLYWSHNSLGSVFFDYPFNRPINKYIGGNILNKEGMSANVGLITEGYFSFGQFGVLLHSLFIALFFLILKQIRIRPVFFGLIFVYIYYINTSFLTVLMLTHGGIMFLLIAYFFLNKKYV